MKKERVRQIAQEVSARLTEQHIGCFRGMDKPLFLISAAYPGVWLEHVYDSVFYAKNKKEGLSLAENTVRLFLSRQTAEGQFPCYIWNADRLPHLAPELLTGYGQIQECVSFARLCFEVYEMNRDSAFLAEVYAACRRWDGWLRRYRMTTGRGLIEMFYGYDTGHDNSARLDGMACPGNQMKDGVPQNAATLPPEDGITPILAVDMNCNFFGTQTALADMAEALGLPDEAAEWREKATEVKENLFRHCFDENDCFFYDADREGRLRKCRSSTVLHLFLEGVLDPTEDRALIEKIYTRYLANPTEFGTPYPFPAVSVSDPTWERPDPQPNNWGYYSEGLIALRCTRWMDRYGFSRDFDRLCEAWLSAWTAAYPDFCMGQELHPLTGIPSASSEWYSSTMLFYLFAARRLGYTEEFDA